MNCRVGVSLSLLVLEGCAILFLCLPTGRKRTSGPWMIAAAVLGAILGIVIIEPSHFFSGMPFPPPFDPNDEAVFSMFGGWILLANFFLGAGIPFLALALWALARGKVKEVPKVD